jgi:hypothetical protein
MFLGNGDFPAKWINNFDVVIASGVWLKDHIPNAAFDDVYAAIKVGGYFVTAMREKHW